MTRIKSLFVSLTLVLFSPLTAGSAYAITINSHSWVSSTGGGSDCTRALPCRFLVDAITVTAAGGVISVLDSGDFGGPSITKSLTIRAEGADAGGTIINGIGSVIYIAAAPTDVVTLEGLRFNGSGGIQLVSGGQLHVVRCVVSNGDSQTAHNV